MEAAAMPDPAEFTVGPPQPVADSRLLPAITSQDEGGFLQDVARVPDTHPDNEVEIPDGALEALLTAASPQEQAAAEAAAGDGDAPEATVDELARLVADVAMDDVDGSGFGVEEMGFAGLDADVADAPVDDDDDADAAEVDAQVDAEQGGR
jgi:hypothetical protein